MQFYILFILSAIISVVSGHARIKFPSPLDAPVQDANGNAYNAPLDPTGSEFPCKGLHQTADLTPTAQWAAGGQAHFEILGHGISGGEGALAAHSGGSCQASLSFDNGATWKVLHSYEGGCPRDVPLGSNMAGLDQTFEFEVPEETVAGNALFAWTWVAVTGNRDEFYMDCASVEITGSGSSTLDDYPNMFVGDMDLPGQIKPGECRSTAGNALLYPDAGTKVTQQEVAGIPFKAPSAGDCYAVGSQSSGTGSSVIVSPNPTLVVSSIQSSSTYAMTTSVPIAIPTTLSSKVGRPSASSSAAFDYPIEEPSGSVVVGPTSVRRPTTVATLQPTPQPTGSSTKVYPGTGYTSRSKNYTKTRGRPSSTEGGDTPVPENTGYPVYSQPTTMVTLTTSAARVARSSEMEGSVGASIDDVEPTGGACESG